MSDPSPRSGRGDDGDVTLAGFTLAGASLVVPPSAVAALIE